MSHWDHSDTASEIVELVKDLGRDVRQQLVYYRASVYKHETSLLIESKIEKLELIVGLFSEESLLEPFLDFKASKECGNIHPRFGECLFSSRVTQLLGSLEKLLEQFVDSRNLSDGLMQNVKKRRRHLLSACKYGSKHWEFFAGL